ncbi:MAG: hypothetical protein AB1384_11505 [Actinomycetota bacterium]
MSILEPCEECGVPHVITREYIWMDNGDIVQKRDQRDRIIFTECENLDPLFKGIENIVGSPIEHVVLDCIRRTYRSYCKLFLPSDVNKMVRDGQLDARSLDDGFMELAIPMGVGRFDFVDMRLKWDERDYYTVSISEPNSLLMCAACHCGAMEAILGYDQWVEYMEVGPDVYKLTSYPSTHPEELKGRMRWERYSHSKGDIELKRCSTCGGPTELSENKWHLKRGVVVNGRTKRRMAVMGPNQIDPIFRELELELGEDIPRIVVEAQRRFTMNGFYAMDDYADVEEFRAGLALRGLGNLKELEIKRTGVRMRMENAVLQLMIVGMIQGIFDAALHTDSTVDWESSPDGTLELEVKPAMFKVSIS